MKHLTRILPLALLVTACATIMHGSSQDIGVSSSPTGAQVSVDNKPLGVTPVVESLPQGQPRRTPGPAGLCTGRFDADKERLGLGMG